MTIILYGTPTCPYSKLTREHLEKKKIPFRYIDVDADYASSKEMVRKSGQMGVPVLDIDGKIIVGWNQKLIDKVIG